MNLGWTCCRYKLVGLVGRRLENKSIRNKNKQNANLTLALKHKYNKYNEAQSILATKTV